MKRIAGLLLLAALFISPRARSADISTELDADVIADLERDFSGAELDAAKRFMAVSEQEQTEWRKALRDTHPGEGCFTVAFPSTTWDEVACGEPENLPRNIGGPYGEQTLFNYSGGPLDSVTGHFPGFSGLVNSCEEDGDARVYDWFTVQLNTDYFYSPSVCIGGGPNCTGWEQFIYERNSVNQGSGSIQFWISRLNKSCPSGWNSHTETNGDKSCWMYTDGAAGSAGCVPAGSPGSYTGERNNLTYAGSCATISSPPGTQYYEYH